MKLLHSPLASTLFILLYVALQTVLQDAETYLGLSSVSIENMISSLSLLESPPPPPRPSTTEVGMLTSRLGITSVDSQASPSVTDAHSGESHSICHFLSQLMTANGKCVMGNGVGRPLSPSDIGTRTFSRLPFCISRIALLSPFYSMRMCLATPLEHLKTDHWYDSVAPMRGTTDLASSSPAPPELTNTGPLARPRMYQFQKSSTPTLLLGQRFL